MNFNPNKDMVAEIPWFSRATFWPLMSMLVWFLYVYKAPMQSITRGQLRQVWLGFIGSILFMTFLLADPSFQVSALMKPDWHRFITLFLAEPAAAQC